MDDGAANAWRGGSSSPGYPPGIDLTRRASDPVAAALEDPRLCAYMVNSNWELVWSNRRARERLFGLDQLPLASEQRNIFSLLLGSQGGSDPLLRAHLALAKPRIDAAGLERVMAGVAPGAASRILGVFREVDPGPSRQLARLDFRLPDGEAQALLQVSLREGALFIKAAPDDLDEAHLDGLADRDALVRSLLRRQEPVLAPMAVLVADLQNSVGICSELPPDAYFRLINEIWSKVGPIVESCGGRLGSHAGDGVVCFFFARPDRHYLAAAAACALGMRSILRAINKQWQLDRDWLTDLYLNIGLTEGQEWLGALHMGDTVRLSALGDTINQAARLSDLGRYGQVFASKSFLTRLHTETEVRAAFGVNRRRPDGREHFIADSFAQVNSILDERGGGGEKLRQIGALSVAELRDLKGGA